MRRYRAGEYESALELAEREARTFPDRTHELYWARICLTARLGRSGEALRLLTEALGRGHAYSEAQLRGDSDLAGLQGMPEFEQLVRTSIKRWSAAQERAKPDLLLREPRGGSAPYPLLLALHGNNSSAEAEAERWEPAASEGWLVALPQSSQIFSSRPGSFGWSDRERAVRELEGHWGELRQQRRHPVDEQRVTLAGFSMGAQLAIWLAMSGKFNARGFIAVAPYVPTVEHWLPLFKRAASRGLRAYFVVGEEDLASVEGARTLASLLSQAGCAAHLSRHPGLGHVYPGDFGEELTRALAFVSGPTPG